MGVISAVKGAVQASSATAGETITNAATDLLPQLLVVGGAAIGIGASILVLRRGWSFFKGLSK